MMLKREMEEEEEIQCNYCKYRDTCYGFIGDSIFCVGFVAAYGEYTFADIENKERRPLRKMRIIMGIKTKKINKEEEYEDFEQLFENIKQLVIQNDKISLKIEIKKE